MKVRKKFPRVQTEHALSMTVYKNEQERIKSLLRKELSKYGKPAMNLEEVRATLNNKLADISLSQLIIDTRKESH